MAKCAVDEFRIAILARRLENCPVRCPPPITLACDKVKASLAIFTGAKIEERVDEPGRHRELPALSGTVRVIIIDLYQISVDERAPNALCLTRAIREATVHERIAHGHPRASTCMTEKTTDQDMHEEAALGFGSAPKEGIHPFDLGLRSGPLADQICPRIGGCLRYRHPSIGIGGTDLYGVIGGDIRAIMGAAITYYTLVCPCLLPPGFPCRGASHQPAPPFPAPVAVALPPSGCQSPWG